MFSIFNKLKMKGVIEMNQRMIGNEKNIVFYSDEEGNIKIEVILQDENVWLNVKALSKI